MAKIKSKLSYGRRLPLLVEKGEDGFYVVECPVFEGCYTQGKTLEEARKRIEEAIELVLDSDKKIRDEKIKSPKSFPRFFGVEDVEIRYA